MPSSEMGTKKRPLESESQDSAANTDAKLAKVDNHADIRRQIEYYFSDENLKYDKFFHDKITGDSEGWLNMELILGCRKIKDMKASSSDILRALEGSALEIRAEPLAIRRTSPLPPLEERRRAPKEPRKSEIGPCIVLQIPKFESGSWEDCKTALEGAFGDKAVPREMFVGDWPLQQAFYAVLPQFQQAEEWISENLKTLTFQGQQNEVTIVRDLKGAKGLLAAMPGFLRKRLVPPKNAKDNSKTKNKKQDQVPITVGGTRFNGVAQMVDCLREVIISTPASDDPLPEVTQKVLEELVKYHPRGTDKLNDMKHFIVNVLELEGEARPKCFFVVRNDGSKDDISLVKCVEGYKKAHPPAARKERTSPSKADDAVKDEPATQPTETESDSVETDE